MKKPILERLYEIAMLKGKSLLPGELARPLSDAGYVSVLGNSHPSVGYRVQMTQKGYKELLSHPDFRRGLLEKFARDDRVQPEEAPLFRLLLEEGLATYGSFANRDEPLFYLTEKGRKTLEVLRGSRKNAVSVVPAPSPV